ncbi:MAG TPA: acyltransferase, partial [Sphingomicrobium sp.]|nr:acyltransferase [Sphingomicrobium sp.]
FARAHLNFDGPARRYLTEAIFPYYIAHQTIIVLAGYWLLPLDLGAGPQFAILIAATVAGCALTFEAGRRIGWLRPLIGLKPRAPQAAAVAAPAMI